jgi:hypothetical protein
MRVCEKYNSASAIAATARQAQLRGILSLPPQAIQNITFLLFFISLVQTRAALILASLSPVLHGIKLSIERSLTHV